MIHFTNNFETKMENVDPKIVKGLPKRLISMRNKCCTFVKSRHILNQKNKLFGLLMKHNIGRISASASHCFDGIF